MKIFKGFNPEGPACPVCKTIDNKPCTLLPIAGTNTGDPLLYQAKAIHVDCLDLHFYPATDDALREFDIIIQRIEKGGDKNDDKN